MERIKRESEEDVRVDQEVLDRIINKLYDFGDGSVDKRVKKKQKKRNRLREDQSAEEENSTKLDCVKDDSVSHVTDAAGDKRTSAVPMRTAGESEGLERKAPDVEIVTFQDPRKKNRLKRAAEAEIKPPKKEYVNYKVLQQMMKEKKTKETQDMKVVSHVTCTVIFYMNVKRQNGVEPTGHVGRFKNGLLLLNSKDIQKLTSKTRK
ncbi:hypothetical protein Baya_7109 [Bagarius yarrelli]|uniref:Uncharacterized protein n=1 Tax=Bagarius yarrelli TaxID=175774 RepID=A0A556TZA5_BAGYA|nr:hypothetical protein Baya_7109 [Bagarius yarrelli]